MARPIQSDDPKWRKKVSEATKTAMRNPEIRRRHLAGLRKARAKHGVNFRGGNGQKPVPFVQSLAKVLIPLGYVLEYCIGVSGPTRNYKVDFALVTSKIAIECDGPKHRPFAQQKLDLKKNKILNKMGWKVIRVPHD